MDFFLKAVLFLAVGLTVFFLLRGMKSFGKSGEKNQMNHFMMKRLWMQALALAIFSLLLYLKR